MQKNLTQLPTLGIIRPDVLNYSFLYEILHLYTILFLITLIIKIRAHALVALLLGSNPRYPIRVRQFSPDLSGVDYSPCHHVPGLVSSSSQNSLSVKPPCLPAGRSPTSPVKKHIKSDKSKYSIKHCKKNRINLFCILCDRIKFLNLDL